MLKGKSMRIRYIIFIILLFLPLKLFALEPVPTMTSVDFYGEWQGLKVGDVVEAYDSDGVVCGKFTVIKDGWYGFLHVYGDDETTADVDEGAKPGDSISLYVNGNQVTPVNPEKLIWSKDGDRKKVDLQ